MRLQPWIGVLRA